MIVMPGAPGLAAFARPGSGCVRHGYRLFLRHFGSRVVNIVLAQVSQQQRDLRHPALIPSALAFFPRAGVGNACIEWV